MLEKRKEDVANKLVLMGRALMEEATFHDYSLAQVGSIMIFMSSLIKNPIELQQLTTYCEMFSAKKVLDGMLNEVGDIGQEDFINSLMNKTESEVPPPAPLKKTRKRKRPNDDKDTTKD